MPHPVWEAAFAILCVRANSLHIVVRPVNHLRETQTDDSHRPAPVPAYLRPFETNSISSSFLSLVLYNHVV